MSIPLILASQSRPRRDVLFSAGICPTIRVSHVDEPVALEREAAALGVTVNDLSVEQRVMILATAKAEAVHQAYRNIADTAAHARGERVVGFPLRAADDRDASSAGTAARTDSAQSADETKTRDFSGITIPTVAEPIADFVDGRPSLTRSKAGPLILGCDSMFLLDGECYGKPHSEEVARERLRAMRGATGELWTGHCLIDFASGRMVRGASKATLHFCEYSDLDIERYIATGEPLEVAGSFTLEGFGGAFIDSIEGDPHGIIGLSLPLARRLAAQLGVEWTDLWNVTRSDLAPDAEYDAKTGAAKPLPPKENVHQPGDGWVDCACGRKHWGTNGASGVLLARRSETTGEGDARRHAAPRGMERGRRHVGHSRRRHRRWRKPDRGRTARIVRGSQHHAGGHRRGRIVLRGPRPMVVHHGVRLRKAGAPRRTQGQRRRKHGDRMGAGR